MAWVPILNIVLTVVFFAMFPVIFPLFLMPQTGVSSLKGYGMGFFYLAAWGPLYVILHMICMTRAESAAAVEQTTGNYSYGNVSWANATSNMRQSDQWSTAPSFMGGGPSFGWRQDNGAVVSGFGNGQDVIDTSGAISRLGFTPTMNTGTVAEWREMASEAHRQSQAYENAANDILTSTHTNRSAFGTSSERSSGWDSSSGRSANTSIDQFDRTTGSSSQGLEGVTARK